MATQDSGWSDYWQSDSAEGEVFVNAKGEKHPALETFWRGVFESVPAGSRVIDVASGAGSIYAHLPDDHGLELHASDISVEALDALAARMAGVETHTCSSADMPFDDRSFDAVVSQFGIEYAGIDAFAEAARLVGDGGMLAALVHVADGYIDGNNRAQLEAAVEIQDSGFIDEAIKLTRMAFRGNPQALAAREKEFIPAVQKLEDIVRNCPQGVHAHLYAGFRKLYESRRQYDESDITDWLLGMQGEVGKTIDRLSRIREAALSEDDVQRVLSSLRDAGLEDATAEAFTTPGNDEPVAWNIAAHRPKN